MVLEKVLGHTESRAMPTLEMGALVLPQPQVNTEAATGRRSRLRTASVLGKGKSTGSQP